MITYEIQIHLLQNWKLSENTDSLFFIETCIIFSEVIIKDLKKSAGGQIIIIKRARKWKTLTLLCSRAIFWSDFPAALKIVNYQVSKARLQRIGHEETRPKNRHIVSPFKLTEYVAK